MTPIDAIALQEVLGYASTNAKQVLEKLSDVSEFYNLSESELMRLGFTKIQAKKAKEATLLPECKRIEDLCRKKYVKIIPYGEKEYPKSLMNIFSPPVVLYVIGTLPDFDNTVSVTIVGPRKISEYGRKSAFSLAARISLSGAVTVSGGAIGGDSAAHIGSMAVGGVTVAILGAGVLANYLKTNKQLREDIVKHGGALISEFVPDFEPRGKYAFPLRNRIMASISNAIAVVEAPIKSGTIITANAALEAGHEVYAVPGRPDTPECAGSNKLISDGAHLLTSPEEILAPYSDKISLFKMGDISKSELMKLYLKTFGEETEKPENKPKKSIDKNVKKSKKKTVAVTDGEKETAVAPTVPDNGSLSPELKKVYDAVTDNGITADELSEILDIGIAELLSSLMILEIRGFVRSDFGNKYSKTFN